MCIRDRHKAEEKDEGFDWPAWQAEKLHSLQRFRRENKSIMAEYSDQIDAEDVYKRQLLNRPVRMLSPSGRKPWQSSSRKCGGARKSWWTRCNMK